MNARTTVVVICALIISCFAAVGSFGDARACTRVVYLGQEGTVITARSMDWMSDMGSNLWVFPRGMRRDGAVGPNSIQWTSRYGSVVVSVFDAATADGMNEKGLVANLLYLAETRYPTPAPNDKPGGAVYSGNASSRFRPATPFTFLAAKPS